MQEGEVRQGNLDKSQCQSHPNNQSRKEGRSISPNMDSLSADSIENVIPGAQRSKSSRPNSQSFLGARGVMSALEMMWQSNFDLSSPDDG